jgi:cytochrome d ubiquinol oxidase subunit I
MDNYHNFGYGFFTNKEETVPPVPLSFYTFHIMVGLGVYFVLYLIWLLYLLMKDKIGSNKAALKLGVAGIFLAYVATEAGWIVAEVGRQPWAIQDLLPVRAASSHLSVGNVQLTFFIFLVLFTALLIAEVGIMLKVIKKGPNLD